MYGTTIRGGGDYHNRMGVCGAHTRGTRVRLVCHTRVPRGRTSTHTRIRPTSHTQHNRGENMKQQGHLSKTLSPVRCGHCKKTIGFALTLDVARRISDGHGCEQSLFLWEEPK